MTTTDTHAGQNIDDIKLILRDFHKIIKVISMYPENNPLPQSMKRSFSDKLIELIKKHGRIEITVGKDKLTYCKETVYIDRSREERLAGLFFDAGLNGFSFKESLEIDDIYKLLDVLKNYVNAPHRAEEFVNSIWEAGITGFTVTTVEDVNLAAYDGDFRIQEFLESYNVDKEDRNPVLSEEYQSLFSYIEADDEDGEVPAGSVRIEFDDEGRVSQTAEPENLIDDPDGSLHTVEAVEAMGFADLPPAKINIYDTNLLLDDEYRLSAEEEELMKQMVTDDALFDMYESTSALLKELFRHETELNGFFETAGICEKILKEFILAGKIIEAGLLLQYVRELDENIRGEKPQWAERLKEINLTAGSRDYLTALTETLNGHSGIGADELLRYLDNFGWEALSGITDLLGELEHHLHRDTLCNYLSSRGRDKVTIIARSITDKRWYVVRNAVIILARIGDEQALSYLKKVIRHDQLQVRRELVNSLEECPNETALEILGVMVYDPDDDLRRAAVEAIVRRRGQKAFEVITDIINADSFRSLARENQRQLLNAYSIIGGDHAVEYLSGLILRANPLKDATLAFFREAAFEALTLNRSEKSEKFLLKLTSSWRPQLKHLATAAIKKRREIIYGG